MKISWHEIPFARLVFPFITGLVIALEIDIAFPFGNWIVLIVGIASSVFLWQKLAPKLLWIAPIIINISLLMLGYQVGYQYDERHGATFFAKDSIPNKAHYLLQIEEIPVHDKWVKCKAKIRQQDSSLASGNVLIYLERDSAAEQLKYGDIILINSWVNTIEPPKNPAQFDYGNYLHFKNIHHQSFIKSNQWRFMESGRGYWLFRQVFSLRKRSLDVLEKYLSEDAYAVGAALILGYREAITDEVQSAYADTGAIHVLAVSGLHVGIVSMILNFLLNLFFAGDRMRWLKMILNISALWLFALLTGASPSVLRASTMFTFVIIGLHLKQPNSIYNNLALSAFILLIFNPFLIRSVGFQLSYLAVLGIVYFQPLLYRRLSVPTFAGDWAWQLTTVAIGAQIGTLPLSLFYFGQFPTLFFISGLIVIPAATLILGLGLTVIVFGLMLPVVAQPLGWLLDKVILAMNSLIISIQHLPVGKIDGIYLSGLGVAMLFLLIGSIIGIIQTRKVQAILVSLWVVMLLVGTYAFRSFEQQQQGEIIIYHIYKNTVVEMLNGKYAITLASDSLNERNLEFATQNYNTQKGIKNRELVSLQDTFQTSEVFYNGSVLHYNSSTLLIITPENVDKISEYNGKLAVDYVLISGSPFLKLEELIAKVECKHYIIDGSNKRGSIRYWKKKGKELELDIHDTNAMGAFRLL